MFRKNVDFFLRLLHANLKMLKRKYLSILKHFSVSKKYGDIFFHFIFVNYTFHHVLILINIFGVKKIKNKINTYSHLNIFKNI